MKRALITGVTGQDGSYLPSCSSRRGTKFTGSSAGPAPSRSSGSSTSPARIHLHQADLLDQLSIIDVMKESDPHEVYNLAAQSFVADELEAAGADRRVHRHRLSPAC